MGIAIVGPAPRDFLKFLRLAEALLIVSVITLFLSVVVRSNPRLVWLTLGYAIHPSVGVVWMAASFSLYVIARVDIADWQAGRGVQP